MGLLEGQDIRTSVPTIHGDWQKKFSETWASQIKLIQEKFGSALLEVRWPGDYPTDVPILYVSADRVTDVLKFLKEDSSCSYNFLADLTATDEFPNPLRFEIVYNLFSHTKFARIRVKTRVKEGEEVPTLSGVWPGANWAEREVWDMFGVRFRGHPDLRRILMDQRWEGHPLRKDYPLRGYQCFPVPELVEESLLDAKEHP